MSLSTPVESYASIQYKYTKLLSIQITNRRCTEYQSRFM